ncbi:MAG: outer membrane lipoprotein-sorting protein [Spirochaetaceae bacterium]|nr:outer membrane lipoprotein-sorting protein [Spirochaetaceae bacterium]
MNFLRCSIRNPKKGLVFPALIFLVYPLWGISDLELLRQADSLASYMDTDFSAEYTIIQEKPGQGRTKTVAGVFRRDARETYVIVIMEPVINKGQGYLKQGKTLWFYDPESRRFNSTSSEERFQNTNARNSDFTRSTLAHDYRIVSGETAVLGKLKCRVLSLEALGGGMTYPKMKIWISEDGLVRKTEDYSLSGQLLRTSAIADYYRIGNRYIPKQILFVDALRGAMINGTFVNERTQISINKPSFRKVADSVFSKTFLETVNH